MQKIIHFGLLLTRRAPCTSGSAMACARIDGDGACAGGAPKRLKRDRDNYASDVNDLTGSEAQPSKAANCKAGTAARNCAR